MPEARSSRAHGPEAQVERLDMKWASTLSRRPDAAGAFAEVAEGVGQQLGGEAPDLLLAFASPDHAAALDRIAALARRHFPAAVLVGCTGGGVIGGAREAEEGPALSLTAAALPGTGVSGFHLDMTSLPPVEAGPGPWRAVTGAAPGTRPKLLLLADPFTMDAEALIAALDRAYPGAPKFGGLASGGRRPGENRLLLGGEVHRSGAVGIALSGAVAVDTVIAQGCRPIGKPMLVTRCRGGLLQELDGRPPLRVLEHLHGSLATHDRQLMHRSVFLGLDMREERVEYDPGELLVRNIVGADEGTGVLAVGAELRPMQAVQFMLRDARTAEEDLLRMLERHRLVPGAGRPAGALLFSCVGRGAGLFGRADHDTGLFEEKLGPIPLGGFFCNGEIGPVGGATFLHGYTSAFALFREEPRASDG
jgi:small ligand-binding sensory domain FIST